MHNVKPPAALAEKPYLQPVYDEPEFIVRNVWRLDGGWYDGVASHLKPAPHRAQAAEIAAMAGGADVLLGRALQKLSDGDLALAAHLIDWAVAAAPDDRAAHEARMRIYAARAAESDVNDGARDFPRRGARVGSEGRRQSARRFADNMSIQLAEHLTWAKSNHKLIGITRVEGVYSVRLLCVASRLLCRAIGHPRLNHRRGRGRPPNVYLRPRIESDDQVPSGGELERAGFGMRLRLDDFLVAHVPLYQQHLMRDLAAAYSIDGKVAEKRAGAHLAESVAQPPLVERIALGVSRRIR